MYNLAKQIDDLALSTEEDVASHVKQLIASVITILNDNSSNQSVKLPDGTVVNNRSVSRQKLRAILRELRKLEDETSNIVYDKTTAAIAVGLSLTSKFYDDVDAIKSTANSLSTQEYIDTPRKEDGLTLRDRTDMQATSYTNDLMKRIRASINNGDTLPETLDEVADVFDGKEWELRRIVTTEVFDSYRKSVGRIAEDNDKEWIKIHESFPRHPRRRMHTCYAYAHEDKYGKGNGVFKPTDEKIYSPHPQCTSWLEILGIDKPIIDPLEDSEEVADIVE